MRIADLQSAIPFNLIDAGHLGDDALLEPQR